MQISGAQMVIEALIAEGVDTVFGYPGGAIMNVYDEIYKQDDFKHILTRHEQAAVHAAGRTCESIDRMSLLQASGRYSQAVLHCPAIQVSTDSFLLRAKLSFVQLQVLLWPG